MSFLGSTKALSLIYGGLITCGMFVAIPLTQIASESSFNNDFKTVSIYKPPPPPPKIENLIKEEKKEKDKEDMELKKDFQKLNLSTIDLALNVGSGGAGQGIYVGNFEIDDSDLNFDMAFEISELDKAPVPLLQIAPMYPPEMKRNGIRGKVIAEFIVTKEGRVVKILITKSSHNEFQRPVLEALRRWQFEPGVKDDQKVHTRVRIPFFFNLDSA